MGHTKVSRRNRALTLVLWIVHTYAAPEALPSAPSKCTPAIIRSIDWGAGSNSFGVRHKAPS